MYSGAEGIRINGSDSGFDTCIVGNSASDGIGIGTTVTRITNCDIFKNSIGINCYSFTKAVTISGCGIDRNTNQGINVNPNADGIAIIGNHLHSNSYINAGNPHIYVNTTTGNVTIAANAFDALDGDAVNTPTEGIHFVTGATAYVMNNTVEPTATLLGLTSTIRGLKTSSPSAPASVQIANDTDIGIIVTPNSATQSASLLELRGSDGIAYAFFDPNSTLTLRTPTGTDRTVFTTSQRGDAHGRLTISEAGFHNWSDGTNSPDTDLYRAGVGLLKTDTLFVGQGITATGLTGATAASRYVGATASGAPASGTFVKGDFVIDQTGAVWICTAAGTPGTWTGASSGAGLGANTFSGNQTAPAFVSSGLTGATAASRYVGATASGAPASGTFAKGDHVIDQTGTFWICTAAGTPGTWTQPVAAGSGLNMPQQLYGYLSWAFDQSAVNGGALLGTAGTITLIKIPWPTTTNVTNIIVALAAGGSALTGSANFAGIYNSSGTLLGSTADQSGVWNGAGTTPKTMAISGGPISVPGGGASGFVYVALLWNGTTSPSFYKATDTATAIFNGGLSAATLRCAVNSSGNTTLPGSLTLSTSTNAADLYWAALT
jgi:hypothetical protein